MCRNIKPLFNFSPPATEEEIREASLQFVRKVSGINKASGVNEVEFNKAVDEISTATGKMLDSMITNAKPRNRKVEAEKARVRSAKRFGIKSI